MSGFDATRLQRLHDVVAGHVDRDTVGGVAWLAARDDDVEVGVAGTLTRGEAEPVRRDSIFRIASMTKPIVAVAALILIEECRLRLEDPVDDLLPELADRRVLVDPRGPMDGDSVPARRPITVREVLTFQLGLGMDFEAPWPQPLLEAMGRFGLGAGPPEPQVPPEPDEWTRRLSTLPLLYQPGERWLYNTGSDVLGVLIARAAGQPLERFLRERVFDPAGMVDTGFATPHTARLGSCYAVDPGSGQRIVYDGPSGQWATPPAFPSGGGGLVSTVDDLCAFARVLLAGGPTVPGCSRERRSRPWQPTTSAPTVARPGRPPTPRWAGGSAWASRSAARGSPGPSAATGGTAAWVRPGPTTPGSASRASC
ncbi:MAG: serine hydrolase [Acidimicrobiia bacterium]|nr:serine hydrolase [Acidimicrobiia bacterium]